MITMKIEIDSLSEMASGKVLEVHVRTERLCPVVRTGNIFFVWSCELTSDTSLSLIDT